MNTVLIRPFAALKLSTFLVLALMGACHFPGLRGNGEVITDSRTIGDFQTLVISGMYSVDWTAGPAAVTVRTDRNLLPHITTTLSGTRLVIKSDTQLRPTNGIKVHLSSPNFTGAELNGAVRLSARGLRGPSFVLQANGASHLDLNGGTDELSADLNGASRLDAYGLKTLRCELSISGAGKAEVTAADSLRVAISGAGKVTYAGKPKTLSQSISGAGSVRQRD